MTDYTLLNKVVLYTANRYIDSSIKEGLEPSVLHHRLKFAAKVFMERNPLTKEDMDVISKVSSDEDFQAIIGGQVSFLVFVLELVKLWVDAVPKESRPLLNISDKKLRIGRAMFAIEMLQLKKTNIFKHEGLTAVINDSVSTAKAFFEYHERMTVA
jgi:hypothetical protein